MSVRLDSVTKYFGAFRALDRVSLEVFEGEIFTLLGPSGCGKTTTLRVIAGFEIPEEGGVYFGDEEVTLKKPYERGTAMVFQNYALWPHMTVFDNVAYGLKIKRLGREEIRRRVRWALELTGLTGLEDRYPLQLSGGQQQRVALARAIVVEPRVLLLDEPLSNLDARLRVRMREEIIALQRRLGITTIYVTHDQEEAMSISDRLAVMDRGRVVQVGTPRSIYESPANLFVATFMGRSSILRGMVSADMGAMVEVDVGGVRLVGSKSGDKELHTGSPAAVVVRPESFYLAGEGDDGLNVVEGRVKLSMFIGLFTQAKLDLGNGVELTVYLPPKEKVSPGDRLRVAISPEDVKVFPWGELMED